MAKFTNVATPLTMLAVEFCSDGVTEPLPEVDLILAVTVPVALTTTLPLASLIVNDGWTARAAPLCAVDDPPTVATSCDGAPAVTTTLALVTE